MRALLLLLCLPTLAFAADVDLPGRVSGDLLPASDEPAAAPAAPPKDLGLVYSGGLLGFGRGSHLFELQERLEPVLQAQGKAVESVDVTHAILAQGDHEVWPLNGQIESALAFAKGRASCDEGVVVHTWVTPTERFVAVPGSTNLPVPDARKQTRRWQLCESGGVRAVALGPADGTADDLWMRSYSLRTGFRWVAGEESWLQLGRPRREPGRVLGRIRQALATAPGARFVDAGNFVDLRPNTDDPLVAAARKLSFDTLAGLKPLALAVGFSELAEGPQALATEAARRELPYVATNWSGEAATFPKLLVRRVELADGPREVVFLGITDPVIVPWVPQLAAAGIELTDPVAAIHAVLDPLREAGAAPDLVVVLGDLTPDLQADLRRRLHGVDLLIGDPSAATFRVNKETIRLRAMGGAFKAAPVTLPVDGVATARIVMGADGPTSVTVKPLEVTADSAADPGLTTQVTALQAPADAKLDVGLIPAPSPLVGVPRKRFDRVVCESLLDATSADVAFLDGLRPARPTPGDLTELQVAERLAGGHVVEIWRIDGNLMTRFLDAAHELARIQCGAPTGTVFPILGGQFIDPARTYRVVTTDVTRRRTRLGELLQHGSADLVGQRPKSRRLPVDYGETLAEIVLDCIRTERAAGGEWVEQLMARNPMQIRPQFLLRVNRLSLRVVRFEGARTDAYADVPETLLNSPSSFTLGGDADLALEYLSRRAVWDLRFTASYTRFAIDDLPTTETADDWTASTSLDLAFASFPTKGPFQLRPFVEARFDSEFTPAEHDGIAVPRQADLTGFAGLSAMPNFWLRQLRLGPFINRDLGRLQDKSTEFGGRLTGSTFFNPLPLTALFLFTNWDVQVFAPTAQDDAADLRLRMWGEVRANVRIVRHLSFGVFVNGLLVQGRVPETQQVAGTATVGVNLNLTAALRLDARPRLFP